MTGTLSSPVVGSPNSSEEPKIPTAITTLNGLLTSSNLLDGAQIGAGTVPAAALASNSVTTAKITDANVTDAKLASPNNSAYKTLLTAGSRITSATVGPKWFFTTAGSNGSGGSTDGSVPVFLDFASGDYTVGSMTTKFRVKMQVIVGSTSPSTVTLTAGLYPLTVVGGSYFLGTVVTGSTTASSGLATNTISRFDSGDFPASALLSDPGQYALGFVVGSITVPTGIGLNAQLQIRHV